MIKKIIRNSLLAKRGYAPYDRECRLCAQRWFVTWRTGFGGHIRNRFCICRLLEDAWTA